MKNDLTQESIDNAIEAIKKYNDGLIWLKPEKIFIPGPIRQYLYDRGYKTQEQILELYKQLVGDVLA